MEKSSSRFKKKFADFQASYDNESYEINKKRKRDLFLEVKGDVLEIGPGTGVNFVFLKKRPIQWLGIEPNASMHPYLFDAARKANIEASLLECVTENICLPDNHLDYIISTEVLCSVSDLVKSLSEIKRVLKPDGKFLFLEHVLDENNPIRRLIQKTVPHTPWKCYSDGCNPARNIGNAIKSAGFSDLKYEAYKQEGTSLINKITCPHIYGWATK